MFKFLRSLRPDKIESIMELRSGETEMWLDTATRGTRWINLKMSVDEIEDLLLAEDVRRRDPS